MLKTCWTPQLPLSSLENWAPSVAIYATSKLHQLLQSLQTRMHQPRMPSASGWTSTAARSTPAPITVPIGSMYAIYGNIYHQYTPNVSIYTIHGSGILWGMIADERYLTLLFASGFQHAWTPSNSHPCFEYFGMMIPIHWNLQDHWRLCPLALQHLCRDELRRRVFDKQLEALSVVLCKGAESAVLLCFHNQYYFIIF